MRRTQAGTNPQGQSEKIRRYNHRRKQGLCVDCGSPAAVVDDVALLALRGDFAVQRGRTTSRCSPCTEKAKTKLAQRRCRTSISSVV